MTLTHWIASRIDALNETSAIARDIDAIEHRYGTHVIIDETRQRNERVRRIVLEQLRALGCDFVETRH
jgi:hypothetical protein